MSDDLHLGMWMRHDVCKNSVMGFEGFESLSSDGKGFCFLLKDFFEDYIFAW